MIRRLPLWPTLIVLAAAALMVALGVWQLHRKAWKEQLLATYAANLHRPAVAFPALWPVREDALYRRTSANCLGVLRWQASAGRDVRGTPGYRHIALCRTGAEGPGLAVDVGVSQSPDAPGWRGGVVRGRLNWLPTAEPLILDLFRPAPAETPMIVSEVPAAGLAPSVQPDPSAIANNHLSYAIQWFVFAALAIGIYLLALARRTRVAPPRPDTEGR